MESHKAASATTRYSWHYTGYATARLAPDLLCPFDLISPVIIQWHCMHQATLQYAITPDMRLDSPCQYDRSDTCDSAQSPSIAQTTRPDWTRQHRRLAAALLVSPPLPTRSLRADRSSTIDWSRRHLIYFEPNDEVIYAGH